jgi:lipid-A-disaccharide synthase
MKYFVIAGEASGDLHGSNLIAQIKVLDANATIHCWGGDLMKANGANVLKHIEHLAFMGFVEVLKNLKTILANFKLCKKQISDFQPDVIVLIDYPGFNLRMAKWGKQNGYKIIYYISPQIWAWKENRVHQIKKFVDTMICILPFEKQFYNKHNMPIQYVGHPLVQVIENYKASHQKIINSKKIIALLPGSRLQEIKEKLPILLSIVDHFAEYEFVIAQSPTLPVSAYESIIGSRKIKLVQGETYSILHQAFAAIVTSGTATLETALFGVPQVVCYKGNAISYAIGKRLIKVPFISLVNLISGKKVVAELIQNDLNTNNLIAAVQQILVSNHRQTIIAEYQNIHQLLGKENASFLAANIIVDACS